MDVTCTVLRHGMVWSCSQVQLRWSATVAGEKTCPMAFGTSYAEISIDPNVHSVFYSGHTTRDELKLFGL